MREPRLIRWSGLALVLAGLSFALFLLLHPYGQLAGAEAARQSTWIPAHTFHFLGALFSLLGLVGLGRLLNGRLNRTGRLGLLLAFVGMAMFTGTGMITAFLWPVIADYAPGFVAADGPMFQDPLTARSIESTYVLLVLGFGLLGAAIGWTGLLPRAAGWLLVVGIVLFSAPVEPFGPLPWLARVAGGLVFGAALIWLGLAVRAAVDGVASKSYGDGGQR